jgi:hypothetical protein
MLSARAMPGGSAAANADELISLRNVRRLLLVMIETSTRSPAERRDSISGMSRRRVVGLNVA